MSFYKYNSVNYAYTTLPMNVVLHTNHKSPLVINFHNHISIEINVVLEGSMKFTLSGREYIVQPGDAVLCNPYALHSGEVLTDNIKFFGFTAGLSGMFYFTNSPLKKEVSLLTNGDFSFDEFYPAGTTPIKEIISQLYDAYTDKSLANECLSLKLFFELFAFLFKNHFHKNERNTTTATDKRTRFAIEISKFLDNHYTEDISSPHAAKALNMDLSYFCRTFNEIFGVTFRNRLSHYRCVRAAELYYGTGLNISEISAAVGFTSYSNFTKSFKRYYGVTPSTYFKERECPK